MNASIILGKIQNKSSVKKINNIIGKFKACMILLETVDDILIATWNIFCWFFSIMSCGHCVVKPTIAPSEICNYKAIRDRTWLLIMQRGII